MRVRTVPLQPHCFFFGGFDIQMHRTLELMQRFGIDAKPLDFWSREEEFDVIHCWGLTSVHDQTIRFGKQYGKKIVVTHLAPHMTPYYWMRHAASWVLGKRRFEMDLLHHVDRLCVHNEQQVESVVKMLRMPREKVRIIPSILDSRLFDHTPLPAFDDLKDYVACIGNIWPRKNQLRVAQAAARIKCPMLFIGNVMGGEKTYTDEFEKLVAETPIFRWYKWVTEDDLRRIYSNAAGVVLASFYETQPGAALEGAAMGKPLVLGNRPYAFQKYYQGAYMADPKSVSSIAKGLEAIRANPGKYIAPKEFIGECHPDWIGNEYKKIFNELARE